MNPIKDFHQRELYSILESLSEQCSNSVTFSKILDAVTSGKTIHAIKNLRIATGCGLGEAKNMIVHLQNTINSVHEAQDFKILDTETSEKIVSGALAHLRKNRPELFI